MKHQIHYTCPFMQKLEILINKIINKLTLSIKQINLCTTKLISFNNKCHMICSHYRLCIY